MDNDRVQDRVMYLEEREKRLEKETHELREQNELLEFRILELEENQDKVRLRIERRRKKVRMKPKNSNVRMRNSLST